MSRTRPRLKDRRSNRVEATTAVDNSVPHKRRIPVRLRLPLMVGILISLSVTGLWFGLPTYWRLQAEHAAQSGDDALAEVYYQRLADWQPGNTDAIIGQVRIARRAGEIAQARQQLTVAKSRGADKREIELQEQLLEIQSINDATLVERLSSMLVHWPEHGGEILESFALRLQAIGQTEVALSIVDRWLKGAPKDVRGTLLKAELLATLRRWDESRAFFEAAMIHPSTTRRARRGLARLQLQSGNNAKAVELFDAAIADDPNNVNLRLLRCEALFDLQRNEEAVADLRTVIELDPDNFSARHSIATELSEQGKHAQVIATLAPILDRFADDVSINYLMGTALAELGQTSRADLYLQRHLEGRKKLNELEQLKQQLRDRPSDGAGILRLAQGYLRYKWDESEPWLIKAIQAMPDSAQAYRAMVEYQRKKGDDARANDIAKAARMLSQ